MSQFISRAIAFGTEGHDSVTARRMRTVNSLTLILMALFAGMILTISLVLVFNGQTPFTIGNLGLLAAFAIIAPTPLFNKLWEYAAATYLFAVLFLAAIFQLYTHGRAPGTSFAIIGLATLIPLIFGTKPKITNGLLVFVLIGVFVWAEEMIPYIGPVIESRPTEVVVALRYLIVSLFIIISFAVVAYAFLVAERAETALQVEHARSEALLSTLLPEQIAARLKDNPGKIIADSLPQIAILFADIVGFTPRSQRMSAEKIVNFLNRIFSEFDRLAEKHGLEKIKTIGDAYMVAAGMPEPNDTPESKVAEMALDMQEATRRLSQELGDEIEEFDRETVKSGGKGRKSETD
ncbi:MAG: hypothetical protein GY761_09135 [Hyphomicrobiales bacterium]|nr:hypothetical protein [Hyphomicrobiales bacterium]